MQPQPKYAKIERERRFLLSHFPSEARVQRIRRIEDRYIEGARLRLRKQSDNQGSIVFKLSQKIPAKLPGAQQGFLTTMYLSEEEYSLLAKLPAKTLNKTRYSMPPFGVDVFEGELKGLLLAEAEFDSEDAADVLVIPDFIYREVSDDHRFTGGRLVNAFQQDIQTWLREYGIGPAG